MTNQENGPACISAQYGAGCRSTRVNHTGPSSCAAAPLCQRIRLSVGIADAQTIEIGWGPDHNRGRRLVIHVHEANAPASAVHLPLGVLLRLWDGEQAQSSTWWDPESGQFRTTSLEVLGDGSMLFKITLPAAGVHVPAALVEPFKFAVGLLLRLSDKTVGKQANLSNAGGTYSTASPCHLCGIASTCRSNALGITLCRGVAAGSIAMTQSGCFVHLDGLAAQRIRIVEQDGGRPCSST